MSAHTDNDGICSYLYVACSELNGCAADNRTCFESDHTCLKHPRCGANPLCLPNDMISQTFCPPMSSSTSDPSLPHDGICAKSKWKRDGIIVAEGGDGSDSDQVSPITRWFLKSPSGIIILGRPSFGDPDDTSVIYRPTDMTIDRHGNLYVIDDSNERILKFLIDKSACVTSKFL
ncbi:hypothetical protein I4U23_012319 [Adineta vaga]|nr:hypothetical protein I4U23_012319 [Adineta vaga]